MNQNKLEICTPGFILSNRRRPIAALLDHSVDGGDRAPDPIMGTAKEIRNHSPTVIALILLKERSALRVFYNMEGIHHKLQ